MRGTDVPVDPEPVNITAEAGIAGAEVIRLGGERPRWSPIASTGSAVTIQADANVTLLRLWAA